MLFLLQIKRDQKRLYFSMQFNKDNSNQDITRIIIKPFQDDTTADSGINRVCTYQEHQAYDSIIHRAVSNVPSLENCYKLCQLNSPPPTGLLPIDYHLTPQIIEKCFPHFQVSHYPTSLLI